MLNLIRLLAFVLLTQTAYANTVRVIGVGSNLELAKQNAFSNAVDQYVGTVVLSERELHNYVLTKNQILVYSSGYVDNFKIISQTTIGKDVHIVVDVSVNTNKISNRILGRFESRETIDGNRMQAQINTFIKERQNADKLLQTVLNDYPYRAFEIKQKPYRVELEQRNPILVMPYTLSWNYNYIQSLNDVFEKVQDGEITFLRKPNSVITTSIKPPDAYVIGKMKKFGFEDTTIPTSLTDRFYNHDPRILAEIVNTNNETVWYICHNPLFLSGMSKTFYSIGDIKNIILFGNAIENGEVRLLIQPSLYTLLQDAFKIRLKIVRQQDC